MSGKTNMTLIKHVTHKGTIMNIWENLRIYKHKTQNKLIHEQIQINTKHYTIFKALNIENTQKTNTYTTITHNKTNLKYQKPTGSHNSQPTTHMYFTRHKNRKAEDGYKIVPETCSK